MKFDIGDKTDNDLCTVLTHEFFRCNDSFNEFCRYAELMARQGVERELSYKTFNAYASFIHHLYEFIQGCHARDARNTNITDADKSQRTVIIDRYVMHHAQRIMDQYRDAIKSGTAPSWYNHISFYDITVPPDFAKDFRVYRNKAVGHVSHERASTLNLSDFYRKYHKFLYLLYKESTYWWGERGEQFPDLKEITDFSILLTEENSTP